MISLAMMLASGAAYSSFMTGNDLLRRCETNYAECAAYVGGVADFLNLMQTRGDLPHKACVPANADLRQLTDVAVKALRDDPASRNQGAAGLVAVAFADAFPCPTGK